jgi:hypothetical protein
MDIVKFLINYYEFPDNKSIPSALLQFNRQQKYKIMDYLKLLAKQILRHSFGCVKKYNPKVIAIVGSVGKTLTKEAIYQVLSKNFFVRRSEKSFTADLGVPLTIIGCSEGVGSFTQLIEFFLDESYLVHTLMAYFRNRRDKPEIWKVSLNKGRYFGHHSYR